MPSDVMVITQTRKWITEVVIGCNFCPFAAGQMQMGTVQFHVVRNAIRQQRSEFLKKAFAELDADKTIETTLLIFPASYKRFDAYLQALAKAQLLLEKWQYEGIYQLASFHPLYLFEGTSTDDPANYTNRSIYPMFHILREASLTAAIESHPDPHGIPLRNISFARNKGLAAMRLLRKTCY